LAAVALAVLPGRPSLAAVGDITTVAGGGVGDDGPATSARLHRPRGVALDAAGNLFIADSLNNRIRKVAAAGPTALPSTPTGLHAMPGNGQVTLMWNAVTGATSYILYMATTPWTTWSVNLPGAMKHEGLTAITFLHDGLPNGTTHHFAVSAVVPGEKAPSRARSRPHLLLLWVQPLAAP
jgi:hypothetical protein